MVEHKIKYKQVPVLTKPLCENTHDNKFTFEFFIKKKKESKYFINWINNQQYIYSNYKYYVIKNINTNDKIKKRMINPVVSPCGNHILYIKKINDRVIINSFNLHNNTTIKIYSQKIEINEIDDYDGDFTFSPVKYIWTSDSKKIILIISRNNKNSTYKNDKSDIYIINFNNLKKKFLVSLEIGQPCYTNIYNNMLYVTDLGYHNNKTTIFSININTVEVNKIKELKFIQQQMDPKISPDGKYMSIIFDFESNDFGYIYDLGIINLQNGNIERITKNIRWVQINWLNNHELIGIRVYGPYSQLYKINVLNNEITQLTSENIKITKYDILKNIILYAGINIYGNIFIKFYNLHDNTITNESQLLIVKNIHFGKVEEINWDGYYNNMRGLLFYPVNYNENKKYGLIVDIHGGGSVGSVGFTGSLLRGRIPSEWFLWTNKKLFVFVPEFRSSGIYDTDAILIDEQKNKILIDLDVKDIESGVDYLLKNKNINEKKMMIIGGSAGAFRANWVPVVSQRYQAIISVDGWNDDKHHQFKFSPIDFIEKIKTPILFIMGNPKLGGVDTNNTVKKYYNALKKNNVDAEYMYINDEGHNFYKKKNIIKIFNKVFSWINKYIK